MLQFILSIKATVMQVFHICLASLESEPCTACGFLSPKRDISVWTFSPVNLYLVSFYEAPIKGKNKMRFQTSFNGHHEAQRIWEP